jgi:hypothetical protein
MQMNRDDARRWQEALASYAYPINAARAFLFGAYFRLSEQWFNFQLNGGDRHETMRFEAHFREFGRKHIEAWYEVIFWKLASSGGRGEYSARCMIEDLREINHRASDLWSACADFVQSGSRKTFERLQLELFVTSGGMPVAATFPAFMSPGRFPMIDRWIAEWVIHYLQNYPSKSGLLVSPSESYVQHKRTTLKVSGDWPFYSAWIDWCRAAAETLTRCTGTEWRARDVEMAAFENARSGSPMLPAING